MNTNLLAGATNGTAKKAMQETAVVMATMRPMRPTTREARSAQSRGGPIAYGEDELVHHQDPRHQRASIPASAASRGK